MKKRGADGWIAISVVACSIVLFAALSMGLSGKVFVPGGREAKVRFQDVTGIRVSSQVKFAGAPGGAVSGIRILSDAERAVPPHYLVELTLNLLPSVPALTSNAEASISADTLLSDKFVALTDDGLGTPLPAGQAISGIRPVTFDELARNLEDVIEGVRKMMSGGPGEKTSDVFARVGRVLDSLEGLVAGASPLVSDTAGLVADARVALTEAKVLVADGRGVISENRGRVSETLQRLESAAKSFEALARRGELLVKDNEKNLAATFLNLKVVTENLKITTAYSSIFLRDLAERPSRLIWTFGRQRVPTAGEILKSRQGPASE